MTEPLAFLALAILVVAAPGPAVAHVVGCALIGGLRLAAAAIAGLVTGQALLMASSLSAGALLRSHAEAMQMAQAAAGVVLLLLGLRGMLRAADGFDVRAGAGGRLGAGLAGVGIVATNPLSLPFLASLALAATDGGEAAPWWQVAMMAALYAGTGLVIYGGYALLAARLASLRQAMRWRVAMRGVAGAAIAAAGVVCLLRALPS